MALQTSQSGRVVYLVSVSQGNVFTATPGAIAWTPANNATGDDPPLNYVGVVYSAANNQKLYFVDGNNRVLFDPLTNTVERWTASRGDFPVDSENNCGRLICNYRGRICVAGYLKAPQRLDMSAVNDPTDWLFLPDDPTPTQAFTTTVGVAGSIGDAIHALIPFNDDVLIIGTAQELHMLQGDPLAGGQIGRITKSLGIAWGQAWTQDPYGRIYFMGNDCTVYSMVPGNVPTPISDPVRSLMARINTGANGIVFGWEPVRDVLHVFVTNLFSPTTTTHFACEVRTNAWWEDTFENTDHNPLAVCEMDGNREEDRVLVMGGWDGYVRAFDRNAVDDDGSPIDSEVLIGPVNTKLLDAVMFRDAVAVLGETSGDVTYEVITGTTAEEALAADPVASGTWSSGRNSVEPIRRVAHALYCRIKSSVRWSFENLRVTIGTRGMIAGRQKDR